VEPPGPLSAAAWPPVNPQSRSSGNLRIEIAQMGRIFKGNTRLGRTLKVVAMIP
jgi:hypothetical protein